MNDATILIAARNASETIQRAVKSAMDQRCPIVLVDDYSSDGTAELASDFAGGQLRVIRPPSHSTLGMTRQTGLEWLTTAYGVWLDADDEFLPYRIDRLVRALQDNHADFAGDAAEVVDGRSGAFISTIPMPAFIKPYPLQARLFERNYLPAIGALGFRTSFAQRMGYDVMMHGSEDADFVLRSVAAGARFCLLDDVGYRIHAYPGSLSRQIGNQRAMYRYALCKHDYRMVRELLLKAGHTDRVTIWALVSMATFREDYEKALSFVAEAAALIRDPMEVLEPPGPCSMPEKWREYFHRGTLLLLSGETELAAATLRSAKSIRPSPEAINNLGAALAKLGRFEEARGCFAESLALEPGYLDATANLSGNHPIQITTHPLRAHSYRSDYSQSGLKSGSRDRV